MSRVRTLVFVGLGVATFVLVLAGAAAAHWTAGGSGSGQASTTTLEPLTVVAGTSTADLSPGGTADAVLEITNPNAFPVSIVGIVAADGDVVAADGIGTCTDPDVELLTPSAAVLAGLGPMAPGGPTTVTLPGSVAMGAESESGCQGATFEVPVIVEVVR